MQKTIEVVYEKGMFKPLEKVELIEGEEIRIEIKEKIDKSEKAREILDKLKRFTSIRLKPEILEEIYLESSRC
ncbi:MAG: antitoxin family protein [Methanomicrobia archaeon]|nr:antitoxin family protein [Methanomicrobia archaeon]